MTALRRLALLAAGAVVAVVGLPVVATAASAHDQLVSADPVDGAAVESLDEITLQFNNSPLGLEGSNLVRVIGPDGRYYEAGCPSLSGPMVSTPVALGEAGVYEVQWRVVSSDGHPIAENFSFTYEPAGDAEAGAGSEAPLCGEAQETEADAAPEAANAAAGANSADSDASQNESGNAGTSSPVNGLWIGIGVGAFAVLAVAIAAIVILRRPRQRE
ncbi:copper resistance protein CopC [Leucobacter sp. USCH14]|uniref:copper resistance CopC family protein n=1 Tax=Leucobacter sp. USCH14 TaxID=3024838 RepID=UPI0030B4C282